MIDWVNWIQRHKLVSAIFIALLIMVIFGYVFNWDWIGVGNYYGPSNLADQKFERSKTLWDWLQFFAVPIIVGIGVWWLNTQQEKTNRDIASKQEKTNYAIALEKQNQLVLEQYFDRMAELLLTPNTTQSNKHKTKSYIMGRVWTVDVLQSLDGKRKGRVLQFLQETSLITFNNKENKPVIHLMQVDLSGVELVGGNLDHIFLEKATLDSAKLDNTQLRGIKLSSESTLIGACLQGADLSKSTLLNMVSILSGVSMQRSDFTDAILNDANLRSCGLENSILIKTKLKNTDLTAANLTAATLIGADLSNANLSNATLTNAKLNEAIMIGATLVNATFSGATLDGADLFGATMSSTQLTEDQKSTVKRLPWKYTEENDDEDTASAYRLKRLKSNAEEAEDE